MEIELKKQDYEIQSSFIIPNFISKIINFIYKYGHLHTINILCILGYFGLSIIMSSPHGPFFWGAMMSSNFALYRMVTSMFLHGGFLHFLVNILSLYVISRQLQQIWKKPQVFIIFFLSAFLANLFSFFIYKMMNANIVAVGASGGLFGLLGALVGFFVFHKSLNSQQKKMYIRQLLPVLIINLLIGVFVPQIALTVHIFGFVIGFLLSAILQKAPYNFVQYYPLFWSLLWLICIITIVVSCIIATLNYGNMMNTLMGL